MWKKDHPTPSRAAAMAPGCTLRIAGAGPLEDPQALAGQLGVNAKLLGAREDLPALMNAADGLVLSSVVEGLPMVLLEAAASGLPSVATAAGGAGEVLTGAQAEFLVPCGDAAALAGAMTRMAAVPAGIRLELGRAARAKRWRDLICPWWCPAGGAVPRGLIWMSPTVTSSILRCGTRACTAKRKCWITAAARAVWRGSVPGRRSLDLRRDVYDGGSQTRAEAEQTGLLGFVIREMRDGRLDFAGWQMFDLVVNNQVMEHVEDLDAVLREIHRVLSRAAQCSACSPRATCSARGTSAFRLPIG